MRAAVREVILGVRFEPSHRRGVGYHPQVMLGPQSDSGSCPEISRRPDTSMVRHRVTRRGACDTVCAVIHHSFRAYFAVRLPPASLTQVPFGSVTNSLPPESTFACPAQACAGPAQSFLPAFTTP